MVPVLTEQIFARNEGPEGLACNAIQLLLHLQTWFTCLGIMCARSSCLLPDEPFESGGVHTPGEGTRQSLVRQLYEGGVSV